MLHCVAYSISRVAEARDRALSYYHKWDLIWHMHKLRRTIGILHCVAYSISRVAEARDRALSYYHKWDLIWHMHKLRRTIGILHCVACSISRVAEAGDGSQFFLGKSVCDMVPRFPPPQRRFNRDTCKIRTHNPRRSESANYVTVGFNIFRRSYRQDICTQC